MGYTGLSLKSWKELINKQIDWNEYNLLDGYLLLFERISKPYYFDILSIIY